MYSRSKGMENAFIALYVEVHHSDLEFQKTVAAGLGSEQGDLCSIVADSSHDSWTNVAVSVLKSVVLRAFQGRLWSRRA